MRNYRFFSTASVIVSLALLSGCATTPSTTASVSGTASSAWSITSVRARHAIDASVVVGTATATDDTAADESFSAAANKVAALTPTTYVGSGLVVAAGQPTIGSRWGKYVPAEDSGGYDAWIVFTEKPTTQVLDVLRAQSLRVQVRYNAPASAQELEAVSNTAFLTFIAELPLAAAESNITDDAITVSYRLKGATDIDLAQRAADATAAALAQSVDGTLPLPIEYIYDPTLVASEGA